MTDDFFFFLNFLRASYIHEKKKKEKKALTLKRNVLIVIKSYLVCSKLDTTLAA